MKVMVIGATGGTGRLVVDQALARGHQVHVFARHPRGLPSHERLHVTAGQLADTAALATALTGCDTVLCCLGVHEKKNVRVMREQLPHIIRAMRQSGCKRLVLLSAFGVGESFALANGLIKPIYKTLVKQVYEDKAEAEKQLPASGLDWTLVYPVILNDKPMDDEVGVYGLKTLRKVNGFSQVPRANVAKAMLDCAQDPSTHGQTLVLARSAAVVFKA